jgi:hypothetical protein
MVELHQGARLDVPSEPYETISFSVATQEGEATPVLDMQRHHRYSQLTSITVFGMESIVAGSPATYLIYLNVRYDILGTRIVAW